MQANHPELKWHTFETDHFEIHFHDETEGTAREGAIVAERIYPYVTALYDYEPLSKTHIVFIDTDDISNGVAYYYDNKIYIWATPLDFELRGSHRWLQNVITHEFVHIVSIQKAMKAGMKFPGAFVQWIGYEKEKRKDVLYGYPNILASYPVPGTIVPPWLAEGVAQFMYEGANWDTWDSHRDMILRDRMLNGKLLTFTEMNTFGKRGIGNESTYNAGFALSRYIAVKYGSDKLKILMEELSKPFQFSINKTIQQVIGVSGNQIYQNFKTTLETRYEFLSGTIRGSEQFGTIIISEGTTNIHPVWAPDGNRFAYLSNKENDFFSQTDLFVFEVESKVDLKITKGVTSAPTWHPSGKKIYYSKKPKRPNKYGSSFYDLFEYDFITEKETRLTKDLRAYSPAYIPADSSIAYIATKDGEQNLFIIDLKNESTQQLTDFTDRRIIHTLEYDPLKNRLLFDHTYNHFRDISYFSIEDSSLGEILINSLWDERDLTASSSGDIIYADDRSGIFNLYLINTKTGDQGYITNVLGGAFMPNVNSAGQVIYSLYEDGGYKIAFLDSILYIEQSNVGYSPTYYQRNSNLNNPILDTDTTTATVYNDKFPSMLFFPKLMMDYGTIKPGLYFYSSEILERLSLQGGASINSIADLDLFFIFEFRRFYPTLFLEVYYLTRNTVDVGENNLYAVYNPDERLRFRLTQFQGGLRFTFFGAAIVELYSVWQRYRAFSKTAIRLENIAAGVAYDYYRGITGGMRLGISAIKPTFDGNINPSNGFEIGVDLAYEKNDFIEGLNLSEAGTLVEEFKANDFARVTVNGQYHWEIPSTNRWTITLETMTGWLSNTEADSFFNYFAGGLEGLQGYPFYSIEGNRLAISNLIFRLPLLSQKHIPLGWFIMQKSVIGFIFQTGNAWSGDFERQELKQSVGIQWRFNGFSFYNFPTAISVELHRGLDSFTKEVDGNYFKYGKENRYYLSILFGF